MKINSIFSPFLVPFTLLCFCLLLFSCNASIFSHKVRSSPRPSPTLEKQSLDREEPDFLDVSALGGQATSFDKEGTSHSFRQPMPNLSHAELSFHFQGDRLFETQFSEDRERNERGLGPVFNNYSCIACHNRDGRGSLPIGLNPETWIKLGQNEALFLRMSIENTEILHRTPRAENAFNAPVPVPGFSTQLFHLGTYQLSPSQPNRGQAEVWIKLEKFNFIYPDGDKTELVKPIFDVRNPYDLQIDPHTLQPQSRLWLSDVRWSPRMGMPMMGLGLLEAIKEEDILLQINNKNLSSGVSGKANYVFDIEKSFNGKIPARSLGRFGLKANTPSILHQSLAALNGDIGVTNQYFPEESIAHTKLFADFIAHNEVQLDAPMIEANDSIAKALVFYSQTLAVPARRNIQLKDVKEGGRLFEKIKCTDCHRPSFITGPSPISALAFQKIYPFTDMLLHDMGEGLADGRQDFLANGKEWRTRPLWGIGLTQVVNPRAGYLHDGRARTLEEAILWHGGEAEFSRQKFILLSQKQRKELIQFLQSL